MAKTKTTFYLLIDDRKYIEQVSSTLQNLDYDILINSGTEKLPKLNKDDFNIIILNPGFSSWEWLNRLIKIYKQFPDLPIRYFLPSRYILISRRFSRVSNCLKVGFSSPFSMSLIFATFFATTERLRPICSRL